MQSLLLENIQIITPDRKVEWGALHIANGKIAGVLSAGAPLPDCDRTLDGGGLRAFPGLIDVHTHGAMGHDCSDGDAEGMAAFAHAKLAEGVTSFLPTTVTLSRDALRRAMRTIAATPRGGAKIPGVHLEGPFIHPACAGAQAAEHAIPFDSGLVREMHALFPILKISFAPELPGAEEFTREVLKLGITPSAAHSNATYAEFARCHAAGLRDMTHFGNRMSPLHHRDIGLVGAGMLHRDIYLELICDNLHLAPEMLQLLFQTKDIGHLILITDSMRASGMPDGDYTLGGLPVRRASGAARTPDGALAGSVLTMNRALANVETLTRLPLPELARIGSLNAAVSLGLEGLGRLEAGYCADIVLFEDDFTVNTVILNGEIAATNPMR